MAARHLDGCLLTPQGWLQGSLSWDEVGTLVAVDGELCAPPLLDQPRVVAGFIDLHVHGGGGGDAMAGAEQVVCLASAHARNGTAALAPTTMTAPLAEVSAALDGIEAVRTTGLQADVAEVLGAHLEGPFLNPKRLGAQPPHMISHDPELVADWLTRARLVIATIAPEIEGGMALLAQLTAAGTRVQLGHTDANAQQAKAALAAGASGFTHLYNAMAPAHHRDSSVIDCALAHGKHAELICDLEHVSEAALHSAIRAIPHAYAITDATAAAGMPDGDYQLGEQSVVKRNCTCYTGAGTLAGTALTMWDCRVNLLRIGIDEQLAQAMVAARPAAYLGRADLGELAVGKQANLVCIVAGEIDKICLRGRWLTA